MILKNDTIMEQLLAVGGTYDINDTVAVTNKQFGSFNVSDDAVFTTLKGVEANKSYADLAAITAAEVDLKAMVLKDATVEGFGGVPYRVRSVGKTYIVTNVQLSAGKFHGYQLKNMISA